MVTLSQLQDEHLEWLQRNFPDQLPYQPLLGLVEEVGELAHSFLKREQGIRGSEEDHRLAAIDAVGDIVIFLASFCNSNGIDLEWAVTKTWRQVKERDWLNNPTQGQ